MTARVLRPSEPKTATFDNQSNSSDWANLYSPCERIDSHSNNDEIMPKQNRIMAYLRVSTKKQDEQMQRTFVETQMKIHKVNLSQVEWIVEKVSASKKIELQSRKEGKKILEAIKTGEVKTVFCYKLDRLFRNQWAAHAFVAECQLHQTDVISMDTPSGLLSDEGFLLYSINFMMAEMEARRLSVRTQGGMAETRKRGGVTTNAVFGWDVFEVLDADGKPLIGSNDKVIKKLLPNFQEQAVINWMRTQQSEGKSNNWIATQLNSISLKGKKGGKWQGQSVKRCLEALQHAQITNFSPPKRMMKWPFADLRKKQA